MYLQPLFVCSFEVEQLKLQHAGWWVVFVSEQGRREPSGGLGKQPGHKAHYGIPGQDLLRHTTPAALWTGHVMAQVASNYIFIENYRASIYSRQKFWPKCSQRKGFWRGASFSLATKQHKHLPADKIKKRWKWAGGAKLVRRGLQICMPICINLHISLGNAWET